MKHWTYPADQRASAEAMLSRLDAGDVANLDPGVRIDGDRHRFRVFRKAELGVHQLSKQCFLVVCSCGGLVSEPAATGVLHAIEFHVRRESTKAAMLLPDVVDAAMLRDVLADNEMFRTAWQEMTAMNAPGGTGVIHSALCTWCAERWPHLDGGTADDVREASRRHGERCTMNPFRIARDMYRAQLANVARALKAVCEIATTHLPEDREVVRAGSSIAAEVLAAERGGREQP